jgi:hypothetical protein
MTQVERANLGGHGSNGHPAQSRTEPPVKDVCLGRDSRLRQGASPGAWMKTDTLPLRRLTTPITLNEFMLLARPPAAPAGSRPCEICGNRRLKAMLRCSIGLPSDFAWAINRSVVVTSAHRDRSSLRLAGAL